MAEKISASRASSIPQLSNCSTVIYSLYITFLSFSVFYSTLSTTLRPLPRQPIHSVLSSNRNDSTTNGPPNLLRNLIITPSISNNMARPRPLRPSNRTPLPSSPATKPAPIPTAANPLYRSKYRPWILTIVFGLIISSGAIAGAGLKEAWQVRSQKRLRAIEAEAQNEGAGRLQSTEAAGQTKQKSLEIDRQKQKMMLEHAENLEARKKELLMKREEIVGKVGRLRERMRRNGEEESAGEGEGVVRGVR